MQMIGSVRGVRAVSVAARLAGSGAMTASALSLVSTCIIGGRFALAPRS